MARRPAPTRRRVAAPTPSVLRRTVQSARDSPIKWLASLFGLIVAAAAAWPIIANWEPIVRWRMADYYVEKTAPLVGLSEKLYLGNLYQRCDKALADAKKADDATKLNRQIRHLDSEIKLAEQKTNTSEYGGCHP